MRKKRSSNQPKNLFVPTLRAPWLNQSCWHTLVIPAHSKQRQEYEGQGQNHLTEMEGGKEYEREGKPEIVDILNIPLI